MNKFFWGNSVSSMQTEGGWNEDGKSKSVYDIRPATEKVSDWHFANDNYHHFDVDLDLMQDLGMNMYRFSVSWSRVIKNGDGEINEAGLKFYDRLVNGCLKRGIEPMICLYHFDMPLHLAEKYNGFLSKKLVRPSSDMEKCWLIIFPIGSSTGLLLMNKISILNPVPLRSLAL